MTPAYDPQRAASGRLERLLGTLALLVQAGAHRVDSGQTHAVAFELLGIVSFWFGTRHPRARHDAVARLLSATPHDAADVSALLSALCSAVLRDEWVWALPLASALERACRPVRPLS